MLGIVEVSATLGVTVTGGVFVLMNLASLMGLSVNVEQDSSIEKLLNKRNLIILFVIKYCIE